MAAPKRSKLERERDLAALAQHYLHQLPQHEIATAMGVTQQQVSYDLKVLHRRWLAAQVFDLNEAKVRELARIDAVEREGWEAWSASKGKRETSTVENADDRKRARIVSQQSPGNPAFLAVVQWCIRERCKILGLYVPDVSRALNLDLSQLDDEQLERVAAGEDPVSVVLAGRRRAGAAPEAEGATGG